LVTDPLSFLKHVAIGGDWVKFDWEGFPSLLLNHPDLVEEALLHKQKSFERCGGPPRLARLLGNGLLRSRGEHHLRQRRLSQPAFHPRQLETYARLMREETSRAIAGWPERIDFHPRVLRLTLAIATRAFFSTDLSDQARNANAAIELLPPHRHAFGEKLRAFRFERKLRRLDETLFRLIDDETLSEESLLHALRSARDLETDGSGMNRDELRDELMTLLIAGHETTASALTWAAYLAASFPEWQAPEYARGIFAEALRLYPPAWVLMRRALETTFVGGKQVPAGTIVVISPYLLGRDARWFPDPQRCDPLRELGKGFYPFGLGHRRCLGEAFAWREGEEVLSTILARFHLSLSGRQPITELAAFTLRPRGGLPLQIHERKEKENFGDFGLAPHRPRSFTDANPEDRTNGPRPFT